MTSPLDSLPDPLLTLEPHRKATVRELFGIDAEKGPDPVGRLVGLAVDGMPSGGLVGALLFELLIAALCLAAFRHRLRPDAQRRTPARSPN